jgi:hypothetical protein
MDKCRAGRAPLRLLLLIVNFPEKWAPLLFAKKEILASEGISLHKERNLNPTLNFGKRLNDERPSRKPLSHLNDRRLAVSPWRLSSANASAAEF